MPPPRLRESARLAPLSAQSSRVWRAAHAGKVKPGIDTKPPLLTITERTAAASASAGAIINLSGAASDGRTGPASVTWTNYQNGQLDVGSGTATGGTHWAITNLSLSAGCTNLIVVTATTTSYNTSLAGHTTFNGTLRVHP